MMLNPRVETQVIMNLLPCSGNFTSVHNDILCIPNTHAVEMGWTILMMHNVNNVCNMCVVNGDVEPT